MGSSTPPVLASTSALLAPSSPPGAASTPSPPLTTKRSVSRLAHPFTKTSLQPASRRDLAVAADASFVETTSHAAANAMAKWYGAQQGGGEWQVQRIEPREGSGARVVYRIRPRSRPETAIPPPATTDAPFTRASTQPAAPCPPPYSSTGDKPHPLRASRSIPILPSSRIPGPPPSAPPRRLQPPSQPPRLRKAGSTPSLSSAFQAQEPSSSIEPAQGGGGQGDVLGRLLGWSNGPPQVPANGTRTRGTARVESVHVGLGIGVEEVDEEDVTDLPEDSVVEALSTSAAFFATDSTLHPMREATSSDSIRTARAPPTPTFIPQMKRRFSDPFIFDAFHDHSPPSATTTAEGSAKDSLVELDRGLSDDPRFVRWEVAQCSPAPSVKSETSSGRRWSTVRERKSTDASPISSLDRRDSSASLAPPGRIMASATVARLVAELTARIEVDLLSGTFLVYRSFVRPIDLLKLLLARFDWAMFPPSSPTDDALRRVVRVRTFVVLRHWVLNHFADDFVPDRQLRTTLVEWLNSRSRSDLFRAPGREKDLRLVKGLKRLCGKVKDEWVRAALGTDGSTARKESDEEVDLDLGSGDRIPRSSRGGSGTHSSTLDSHRRRLSFATPTLPMVPGHGHSHGSGLPDVAQSIVARSFTSALGTFGRFKRLLGTNRGALPHFDSGRVVTGEAGEEQVEFERTDTGDLLWVREGLDRYLEFHNIPREDEPDDGRTPELLCGEGESGTEEGGLETPSEASAEFVLVQLPSATESAMAAHDDDAGGEIPNSVSTQTIKNQATRPTPEPATFDLLNFQHHSSYFNSDRPVSTRVELDDVDLSDEDDDVMEVKKTLRRLPGAHNLRLANAALGNAMRGPRQSLDSMASSYGEIRRPSYDGPERESVMFVDDEEGVIVEGKTIIPNFVWDVDSDDDEPGDVEAALKRLEGIVDDSKEREKARRVERQMEKSQRVKLSNESSSVADSDMDDDPDRRTSSSTNPSSSTSSSPASTSSSPTEVVTPAAPAPPPAVAFTSPKRIASTVAEMPTSPTKHTRNFSRRDTLANRPSISRIFAAARPLSTRPVGVPTHRSFILLCRTEVLAQQLCLIERDMFRLVCWQELVGGAWREPVMRQKETTDWEQYLKAERIQKQRAKEAGQPGPSTVAAVIARYNLTANWVASEVVLTLNPDERVALVAKFIRLAFKCYCQSNFQSLTQIIHGLSLPDVERLRKTWLRVPKWEMRKYKGMKLFVAPERNFKHLREATATLLAEYGSSGQRGPSAEHTRSPSSKGLKANPPGCLPFLGIILKDLSVTAELPTYLDPTSPGTPANVDDHGRLTSVADPEAFAHLPPLPEGISLQPLVNLNKFRVVASAVQQLLAFQELAGDYSYPTEPSLYLKALKIRSLDFVTMQRLSTLAEA